MPKRTEAEEARDIFAFVIHACSAVARDRSKYLAFRKEIYDTMDRKAFCRTMKDAKNNYACTQFFQERSASLAIKSLEVFAASFAREEPLERLTDFLRKRFPRYQSELAKQKGGFPDISFFTRGIHSVHEVLENVSVYVLLFLRYDGKKGKEAGIPPEDKQVRMFISSIPSVVVDSGRSQKYRGRISSEERRLRKTLIGGGDEPATLYEFFDDDNQKMLNAIAAKFCFDDLMECKFTEKDANALARCIIRDFVADEEEVADDDEEENLENLTDPKTLGEIQEHLRVQRNQRTLFDVDLNYARLMYAFGKISSDDRNELLDMYMSNVPKDEKEEDPDSALKRMLSDKDAVVREKQSQLNKLQLELDKANKKLAEAKEKYIDAKNALGDMQKVIEGMQKGDLKVSDIEEDAPASFPDGAVLFGGHPNWLRKFRLKYPGVKVYDADDMSFTTDVIRNAELILINVTHMSHKQYAPVIKAIRQYHKNVEYIK